ncbi:organic cation transporter 1-like isoform X2 [Apostichopus japonicus]|uniref:organic cation transporter 1-like isoform X2 n=1 Tax=Stichopus japonicus TaxID=307972 RepID=UPI003AB1133A
MSVQLDDAYSRIGDYGRGQVLIFFIICSIGQLPASWHIFAIVFLGATPNHWCKPASVDTEWAHVTDQIGYDIAKCGESEEGNSSISCENGWFYSDDLYGSTIVSQWDLVCDQAGFAEISQTVLMVGVMVGSYLAGYLADRFGRKPILFISLFVQGIVGTIQAFSSSFTMFIIVRFFIGVLDQGYELPVYTMVSELFTPRWRPYSFICMMNFWAGGILSLPIIAYFIRDWRYLQLAISIPFLFLPIFYWVVPESPRWLLSNGRYEEATAIVKKIAHFNGKGNVEINFVPEDTSGKTEAKESVFQYERNVVMEEDINGVDQRQSSSTTEKHDHKVIVTSSLRCDSDGVNEVTNTAVICDSEKDAVDTKQVRQKDGQSKATPNSYLELFNGCKMSLVSLVLSMLWFVTAFSYYGLSLNAGHIAGDPYLNVFLSGAVEIPSHFLATGIVVWFGRRWPIFIFLLVTGMACVGVSFIPEETETKGSEWSPLRPVLVLYLPPLQYSWRTVFHKYQ